MEETLNTQHNAKPIHSVEEMEKLATLFSDSIKLFVAIKDNKILGGTLVFENKTIVHT